MEGKVARSFGIKIKILTVSSNKSDRGMLLPRWSKPIVHSNKSNQNQIFHYYAEARIKFARPISASLRQGNTARFEEMMQRWQIVGNTVSALTAPMI